MDLPKTLDFWGNHKSATDCPSALFSLSTSMTYPIEWREHGHTTSHVNLTFSSVQVLQPIPLHQRGLPLVATLQYDLTKSKEEQQ